MLRCARLIYVCSQVSWCTTVVNKPQTSNVSICPSLHIQTWFQCVYFAHPSHVLINPQLHTQAMFSGINVYTSKPCVYVTIAEHPSYVSMYLLLHTQVFFAAHPSFVCITAHPNYFSVYQSSTSKLCFYVSIAAHHSMFPCCHCCTLHYRCIKWVSYYFIHTCIPINPQCIQCHH